jgi:galactokinase
VNLTEAFRKVYGKRPELVVSSPGRVNLIGDHTDYNDGYVLPFAINRYVEMAARARNDNLVVARSEALPEPVSFNLTDLAHGGPAWGEYLKGVAHVLSFTGPGFDLLIRSGIPVGAGLSSSAALQMALARLISSLSGDLWDPIQAARLGQRAENEWVGNACGIMDQLVIANGVEGSALLIDCRTLHIEPQPLPEEIAVVVLDTGTRRDLRDSGYNERREACDRASAAFGVPALRDISPAMLADPPQGLSANDLKRVRHVVSENGRVLRAAEALRRAEHVEVGRLMTASHESLRDEYEVSTKELDQMVSSAMQQSGCLGVRMTGAGFGGCVIAFVEGSKAEEMADATLADYRRHTQQLPSAYTCHAVAGTSLIPVPVD